MSDFKKVTKYSNVDALYNHEMSTLHIWGKEDGEDVQLGLFYVLEED